MVKEKISNNRSKKKAIYLMVFIFFHVAFSSCSHKYDEISYSDQVSLNIEDKFFTVQIDSIFYGVINYRLDIAASNQFYRYWIRNYNDMLEVRFCNIDTAQDEKGYNYLFGIKNNKAFYLRWRNEPMNTEIKFHLPITSDIGENTVELQTNLPKDIVKYFYADVKCPIEIKDMNKAKIKRIDIGRIMGSNYQPFY